MDFHRDHRAAFVFDWRDTLKTQPGTREGQVDYTRHIDLNGACIREALIQAFSDPGQRGPDVYRLRRDTKGQCALCGRRLHKSETDIVIPNGDHGPKGTYTFHDGCFAFGIRNESFCACPCCLSSLEEFAGAHHDHISYVSHEFDGSIARRPGHKIRTHIIPYKTIYLYGETSAHAYYTQSAISGIVDFKVASALVDAKVLSSDWDRRAGFAYKEHVFDIGHRLGRVLVTDGIPRYYDNVLEFESVVRESNRIAMALPGEI